ncbi:hypothetical protein L1987_22529 [Smallanthus sonchifolius]|uniref:Uncharacterized protein n=1 Tax=Smallanthus sonchifolius TaxID=185202 RepID=A0ACB9IEE1_9ASTR|nr:hypothetical protein L1987_22529 [Smallanthus sonchifolius]
MATKSIEEANTLFFISLFEALVTLFQHTLQTLDIVMENPDKFRVVALAAGSNVTLLASLFSKEYNVDMIPKFQCVDGTRGGRTANNTMCGAIKKVNLKDPNAHTIINRIKATQKICRDFGTLDKRITALENLQNAKAEASIRKLEMKLEKKKLESMDKIMNKLRIA